MNRDSRFGISITVTITTTIILITLILASYPVKYNCIDYDISTCSYNTETKTKHYEIGNNNGLVTDTRTFEEIQKDKERLKQSVIDNQNERRLQYKLDCEKEGGVFEEGSNWTVCKQKVDETQ